VLGHSIGEYAAATAAGVFELKDALPLVIERGRIMSTQPPGGGMLACLGKKDAVLAMAARHGLSVAADNAPESVVISGAQHAIDAFRHDAEREGISTQALRVSHAFHSAMMDGALDPFEAVASGVPCAAPKIPLISNLTGRAFEPGEVPSATYWRRQLREAVQFATGTQSAHALGCTVFVEVGPASSLLTLARLATHAPGEVLWLPSLRRGADEWRQLLEGLGTLWVHGAQVNWHAFHGGRRRNRVSAYSSANSAGCA
jgi:acyl transferase domain-containing protein